MDFKQVPRFRKEVLPANTEERGRNCGYQRLTKAYCSSQLSIETANGGINSGFEHFGKIYCFHLQG
jgi:hypothetical protein